MACCMKASEILWCIHNSITMPYIWNNIFTDKFFYSSRSFYICLSLKLLLKLLSQTDCLSRRIVIEKINKRIIHIYLLYYTGTSFFSKSWTDSVLKCHRNGHSLRLNCRHGSDDSLYWVEAFRGIVPTSGKIFAFQIANNILFTFVVLNLHHW